MFLPPEETGNIFMLTTVQGIIGIVALLIAVANTLWTWVSKGQSATSDRVKKVEEDTDKLEKRVQQLEGDFRHLPTKEDISGLRIQLENMLGKINKIDAELVSNKRTVDRIDDYLREKA